jgi:hypothetical protein
MTLNTLKNLLWQRIANFLCMRSSLLESVIIIQFQATEAYSHFSLDLTKAKYRISKLSVAENENVIVRINLVNFIACEKIKQTR